MCTSSADNKSKDQPSTHVVPLYSERPSSEGEYQIVAAEYLSLRGEILKLIELQSQIVSLLVVALGAMISFGFQVKIAAIVLTFPFLSLVLGIIWLNHAHAISRCAAYLSSQLEPRIGSHLLGWESFVRRNPLRYGTLGYWGVRSIFPVSSICAAAVGISLVGGTVAELCFSVVSVLVSVSTVALFLTWREPSPRKILLEEESSGAV